MKCRDIIEFLRQQFPESMACGWDNVGLLAGSMEKEVHTVYIALDATDEAIAAAVEAQADMLLTHHPLIFKGIRQVNSEDFIGRRILKLIRHDMAYYAMHTNFDVAAMADLAAERLGLSDIAVLQETGTLPEGFALPESAAGKAESVLPEGATSKVESALSDGAVSKAEGSVGLRTVGIGKIGMLPCEMTLEECAELTKCSFGLDKVKVFGEPDMRVQCAAVCPGSGKSVIEDALKKGAQVLITGDIDHHEGIDAVARGMAVIDAGHYGLEQIFIPYMKEYLEARLPELTVIAQAPKPPFRYI